MQMNGVRRLLAAVALSLWTSAPAAAADAGAGVRLDVAEAEAALVILERQHNRQPVGASHWRALFASEGYRRVHERETSMGRAFEESDMRAYLTAPAQVARAPLLRRALEDWREMSMDVATAAALAYLPETARIGATVYIVIKPRQNSFVFGIPDNPAIFLSLDPAQTRAVTQNTVTHEMHHVGFGTACPPGDAPRPEAPAHEARLRMWMGAYGEGFAMLAAAGGPDIHPHAASPDADRTRWDSDVSLFRENAAEQNAFFVRVMSGELRDIEAIDAQARTYYGVQGPWYTVGYVMASTIERAFGRARLVETMCRQSGLLATYNAAALALGEPPVWDAGLAARLGGE